MTTDWSRLEQVAKDYESPGTIGVSVISPQGERWASRGDHQFPAASTVKIPYRAMVRALFDRSSISQKP